MFVETIVPSGLTAHRHVATFSRVIDDKYGGTIFTFANSAPEGLTLMAGSCDKF